MSKPKISIKQLESQIQHLSLNDAVDFLTKEFEASPISSIQKLLDKYTKKKVAQEKEFERFMGMTKYEHEAFENGYHLVCGIDEAGRGPLAGPVVAAAVILPKDTFIPKLNDSKKLSSAQRDILFDEIKNKAISWAIGIVDEKVIDEINILNAAKKAMQIALENLSKEPDCVLIDAVKIQTAIPQTPIIHGDALSISIAAASIIAKVTRDRMMHEWDKKYPHYGFSQNKGYGTEIHLDGIKKFGLCPIHRLSFTKKFVS